MINLCYLKKKIDDQEEFYDQFLTEIFPHTSRETDLVITAGPIKKRDGFLILDQNELDLETLSSLVTSNIFLVEFDDISNDLVRSIINMKSKRSEIIGISNNYNEMFKTLQTEVQGFKDLGYNSDHIAIALVLKNNMPPSLVSTYLEHTFFKRKNTNVKEISNLSELTKLIKK